MEGQRTKKTGAVPCDREDCMKDIVRGIKGYVAQEVDLTDPETKAALVKEYLLGLLEEATNMEIDERIVAMRSLQDEMNRFARAQMIDEDFQADMRFKIEAAIKIDELFRTQKLSRTNIADFIESIRKTAEQNELEDFVKWAETHELTAGEQLKDYLKRYFDELFQKAQETATAANEMVNTVAKPSFYFLMTIICSMPLSCRDFLENALNEIGLGWLYTLAISYCAFWQTQTGLVLYRKVTGMTPDEKNALFTKLQNLTTEGCVKFSTLLNTLVAAAGRGAAAAVVLTASGVDKASDIMARGLKGAADVWSNMKSAVWQIVIATLMRAIGRADDLDNIYEERIAIELNSARYAHPDKMSQDEMSQDEMSQESASSTSSRVSVRRLRAGEQPVGPKSFVIPVYTPVGISDEEKTEIIRQIEAELNRKLSQEESGVSSDSQDSFGSEGFETPITGSPTSSMDLGGGRRRKSRRHKKRKSTLKRRRLKRRRTRKGKKRRHTRKH
jgi:hypothetical protein